MMSSMKGAMGGLNFEFFAGPAILGALIRMMVGVGFGVLASLTRSAEWCSSPPLSSGVAPSS